MSQGSVSIDVSGYDFDEVIGRAIESHIREEFGPIMERKIDQAITERLREWTHEKLRAEFDRALSEGWTTTDGYGNVTGKRTLKDWVLRFLEKGNGYSNPVESVFREQVERALRSDLGQLLEQAKQQLKAQLDGAIAEKLRKAVTEAVR